MYVQRHICMRLAFNNTRNLIFILLVKCNSFKVRNQRHNTRMHTHLNMYIQLCCTHKSHRVFSFCCSSASAYFVRCHKMGIYCACAATTAAYTSREARVRVLLLPQATLNFCRVVQKCACASAQLLLLALKWIWQQFSTLLLLCFVVERNKSGVAHKQLCVCMRVAMAR